MKATLRPNGGTVWIEVEGKTEKDLFENLARIHDVFMESECGLCGSKNIKPVVRHTKSKDGKKEYSYPEWQCKESGCGAHLIVCMNNNDSGTLFTQRRLLPNGEPATGGKNGGKFGKHNGWTKFRGKEDEEAGAGNESAPKSSSKKS